jgi:Xaa-Pro aminopeptidase
MSCQGTEETENMEREKITQAQKILKEQDIDCWMIVEKETEIMSDPIMDYVLGTGVVWLSFFMFFKSGAKYAIIGNLDKEKIERMNIFDGIYPYKNSPREDLLTILKKHNPRQIALNFSTDSPTADGLSYGKYLSLKELLKNTDFSQRFVSAETLISKLRGRKSKEEISRIEKAIEITLDIYSQIAEKVKPGFSEKQVASFISGERKKLGLDPSWDEDHCPSVFTGPQESGAHSGPTEKLLERGHVFNIDFGVIYEKYCSDLQRTWYILEENQQVPPPVVTHGFSTIVESIRMAFEALKPGVLGIDIDRIARSYITSRGYDEYPHALGHQVGRSSHDGGALLAPDWERYGKLPFTPLEAGQVFTIEPRLYLKKHGVITIEEMVLITADGAEWLSDPQKELYVIK